jgi:general nucleoside transport system permease protein
MPVDVSGGALLVGLLTATVRMAVPLLLAALGELLAQRAGILNVGVEGIMLAGALAAFLGAFFTGHAYLGVMFAAVVGASFAWTHAYFSIALRADQAVSGIALNLVAFGLTTFVFRSTFGLTAGPPTTAGLVEVPIPLLSDLPIVGTILFRHNLLVYVAFLLVPLLSLMLFHTRFGLQVRAVGENPLAAECMGISVHRIRYLCTVIGGMLAGLAGSVLSLGLLNLFQEGITGGRGFIALAVVVFGNWNPLGALMGALIFSVSDALQLRLQALGVAVPHQLLLMSPYLVTLVTIVGVTGRSKPPAALAAPYRRN